VRQRALKPVEVVEEEEARPLLLGSTSTELSAATAAAQLAALANLAVEVVICDVNVENVRAILTEVMSELLLSLVIVLQREFGCQVVEDFSILAHLNSDAGSVFLLLVDGLPFSSHWRPLLAPPCHAGLLRI